MELLPGTEPGRQTMLTITIEPTFPAWRQAARGLVVQGAEPRDVEWREAVDDQASLGLSMDAAVAGDARPSPGMRVSRRFVEVAEAAACHADPQRWGLLYR